MKYLKYSFFVLFILSFASCNNGKFSQIKTIEFPVHESRLAVTAQFSAPSPDGDINLPEAFISHSLGIVDEQEYEIIDEAVVELHKDGSLLYELTYDTPRAKYIGDINQELTEGTYTLKVDAPNFDAVEVVQTMPRKAEVLSSTCLLYTSPSPRDATLSRMPSSA